MAERELNLEQGNTMGRALNLIEAIDYARDQGTITWLTFKGERIAAIVPVDAAKVTGDG